MTSDETDFFRKESRDGHVVLWNTDTRARNALSPAYYDGMIRELQAAADDPSVAAVVLAGEGGYFCSGGNLNLLKERRAMTMAQRYASINRLHAIIRAIHECPKPVISAIEGGAAGAGLSIALVCDMVVSASDATFSLAYVKAGLVPDGGITHTLLQNLPRATVTRMALLGDAMTARRLHDLGAITELTEPGAALDTTCALAERLAAGPERAIATIKHLLNEARSATLHEQLEAERKAIGAALGGEEAAIGIAAFLDKKKPVFR